MRPIVALLAVAVACGAPTDPPAITSATPPHGPLIGGTRITIHGSGFASPGAAPNRVLIGGREAPLVATTDDATLEVLTPPGDQPGDAELLVLNGHGNARATGVFHYSTPPQITSVSPARVHYLTGETLTVTGTGFLAEGAGDTTVLLDGFLATNVEVLDDTLLTFSVPGGRPLDEPDLELVNHRGHATHRRGFRYVPSDRPGLLLFPHNSDFAYYFDPTDGTFVTIPWVTFATVRLTAVVRDEHDHYWGVDNSGRRFGRIDLRTQQLEHPIEISGWHPTMIRVGDDHLALDRNTLSFGRFHPATGLFTPIGDQPLPCCGSYGLAANGSTIYMVTRTAGVTSITTVDPVTGATGTPVAITTPSNLHVEEMRFFDGVLYASNRNGTLITIDPATGDTAVVPFNPGRIFAMEVFE